MNLRIKIVVAKELKRIGIAIAVATLGSIVVLVIGLYYEKQEYAKYLQKKTEVESEVVEWKKETLKRQQNLEDERRSAFIDLLVYVKTNRYFSQSYNDYKLRWGFDSLSQEELGLISFVKATLQNDCYNEHIRKLGILYHNYKNCYIINSIDIMKEEQERLYRVSSFSEYRKHLGDNYSSIRKYPPIESAFYIFVVFLYYYVIIRFLILIVQLIVKAVKWIHKTSKLPVDNIEEYGGK